MDKDNGNYLIRSDVIQSALKLVDDMEKVVISFADIDCKENIFKFQKKLLKNIALVKTVIETNSVDILSNVSADID